MLVAVVIVFLCFFGDGILETFLAILVRGEEALPAWAAGMTLGLFHVASWGGRLATQNAITRWDEKYVLIAAGLLSSAAMAASLWLVEGWTATIGFALVGLAISPIVPLGMSLAGRHAPVGTQGQAIGLTNAVGYSAFIASPLVAGLIADRTSITAGVGLAALTMLGVAIAALALPHRRHGLGQVRRHLSSE